MMELLSPAGTYEKLVTAFDYGADAVYMGLKQFSMRANAGNFTTEQWQGLADLKKRPGKPDRKIFCAINVLFHEQDLYDLQSRVDEISQWPFDAFIVSDLGAASLLKKAFPNTELHLSTQASCTNSEAAKVYHDFGFSRIVLGRETPLEDIRKIKDANPQLELEVFVHGAMCMAYSGRCLLSAHLTGRSGNQGDCAHTCRWGYQLMGNERMDSILSGDVLALEEAERPGTYYPIAQEDGHTTILSSKDLCMIDHLEKLKAAGVDSLKIEGRMKSLYYVATVTRAYRKALDATYGLPEAADWKDYRNELFNISHREYSTGFFFGQGAVDPQMKEPEQQEIGGDIDLATMSGYIRDYLFLGLIKDEVRPGIFALDIRNQIREGQELEFIGPDVLCIADDSFIPLDDHFNPVPQIDHGKVCYLKTDKPLKKGYLIRRINIQNNH